MKVGNIITTHPHKNIVSWVNAAAHRAFDDIRELLRDESEHDAEWFVSGRRSRLSQLVNEIFTLKLVDASDGKWTEQDFEGHEHSSLISKALADLTVRVTNEYRRIVSAMEK